MRKFIKFLIGIGMLALIAGGIILGIAIKTKAFSVEEIVTKEYKLEEDFNNINIDLDVANVKFVVSEDMTAKVVCVEKEKNYHEVSVKDDKLNITAVDTHKWYERIFDFDWTWKDLSVTVYLPKTTFNFGSIKSSTGDIELDNKFTFNTLDLNASTGYINVSANVLESLTAKASTGDITLSDMNVSKDFTVSASTGRVTLKNINCDNLLVDVSTGYINLNSVIANSDFKVKSSTGDIYLINVDGKTMSVKTSTGDINIVVLTPKKFVASSSTGDVDIPETTGDECVLKTSTGNIHAEVK